LRLAGARRSIRYLSTAARFYYTGDKFTIKDLTDQEVEEQLRKWGVQGKPETGREVLNNLTQTELATRSLSVDDAAQLMSSQDLQRELRLRDIPSTAKESDLRVQLLQAMKEEEEGLREPPEEEANSVRDSFQNRLITVGIIAGGTFLLGIIVREFQEA